MDQSDSEIARRLAESNYLGEKGRLKVEVWERGQVERVWAFAKEYREHHSTLYAWAQEVQAAIDAAKVVTARPSDEPKRRNPFKITTAHGSRTEEKDDPTPLKKMATETSSWDEARLRLVGAVDRYSRKRR